MRGEKYVSASGDEIPNLGEQTLEIQTEDGTDGIFKYQSADVQRPLNAVSGICDGGGTDGQLVVFHKWGGYIYNPETGRTTEFPREDNIYTLGVWVKPKSRDASDFPRQGR